MPDTPHQADASAYVVTRDDHALVLHKQGKQFVFPCPPGKEGELMQQLGQLIADPHNPLTWFDAALLCDHLGKRMSDRLSQSPPRRVA